MRSVVPGSGSYRVNIFYDGLGLDVRVEKGEDSGKSGFIFWFERILFLPWSMTFCDSCFAFVVQCLAY